jgi:DNA-binding MarR family transcriptional regulator
VRFSELSKLATKQVLHSLPSDLALTASIYALFQGNGRIVHTVKTDMELTPEIDLSTLSGELRVVLGQMIRRLRVEFSFPLTQASVLSRLYRDGPQCIGELATAERVRPQSMSQTLAELEVDNLIYRNPDANDGRRTRITLTDEGRTALEADRAVREGWLAREIEVFTLEEQETLYDAVLLLRRLAEAP